MNRKVISLLAILAMLVSMLTCIVIPLSAEDSTESTQTISVVYDALIQDFVDYETNEALTGFKEQLNNYATDEQLAAYAQENVLPLIGSDIQWKTDFHWEDDPFPLYEHHKAYEALKYGLNEWSISSPADWEAMREVADAANVPAPKPDVTLDTELPANFCEDLGDEDDYFENTVFHLTNDVEFTYNDAIDPLGFSVFGNGGGFAGTINGHGYGFNNIYVLVSGNEKKDQLLVKNANNEYVVDKDGDKITYPHAGLYTGLFHRLADCEFIDFGINSALIKQGSGSNDNCVSSFGTVDEGKTPTFTRVWSSAVLSPNCNATASALVGSFEEAAIHVNVNGFVFDGAIVKGASESHGGQLSYALYSCGGEFRADGNDFYNIITDFRSCNGTTAVPSKASSYEANGYTIKSDTGSSYTRGGRSALFSFSSVTAFRNADIKNVYAVKREIEGINEGYTLGKSSAWGGYDSDSLLTDMSAREVAQTINEKNLNGDVPEGVEPVYFKLNNEGKIRPFAKEDFGNSKKVVRLTLTGSRNEEIYVDREVKYNFTVINKTTGETFTPENTSFKQTSDLFKLSKSVTVEVTDSCTHSYEYEAGEAGKNVHTATCTCGYTMVEACTSNEYAPNNIAADAMTHSGTCDCGETITQNCDFEYDEANNKYVCTDCERTVDALAPMVPGDVNGNGSVNLFDAIQLLKNTVDPSVDANVHNADVDGNNCLDVLDAVKIIKIALKDKKTLAEVEDLAELVNEPNYYSKVGVADDGATLTLAGEEKYSFNDRYVLTNGISGISKGNKITFGPVRLGQAVMGYFYKADGTPLQLINHTNVTVEHQFKQGMVMVSVSVPQGADTVRFQVNAEEKDRFYIRINNDFTVEDYQCRANLKEATLENPLKDQLLLTVGDSLCAAANLKRDSKPDGNLKGWARRIYQQFGAKVINSAEGGAAISAIKFKADSVQTDTVPLGSRQCIVNQLSEHTNIGRELEYILLEGAGNDAANEAEVGEVSPLYDPESFDMTTYAGGLEMMIYTAIKEHGDTAAIGYMSYYDMPYAKYEGMHRNHEYFEVGKQICEKWGIEYLDLNTILTEDILDTHTGVHTHDAIHANDDGYDIMQPYINAFLPQMRPASKAIYDKVQKYADYTVGSFNEYSPDGHYTAE